MTSDVDKILAELKQTRGIDLSGYRRSMLERRLCARMAQLQLNDSKAYLEQLRSDPAEYTHLVDCILINVSSFFRNPLVFEIIAQSILPSIIERKRIEGSNELRVWCAGCAEGEEAYSIAILTHQVLEREERDWIPYIFATDMDSDALRQAEKAIFPRASLENTKLGILDKYFTNQGNFYEVRPFIRKMVRFSQCDLTSPKTVAPAESVFGTFDLVLCRNVLIYFTREVQERIFTKLYKSLAKDGYLILGEAEALDREIQSVFRTIDSLNRIFIKQI
ncbi:CheR family methyltransferase [Gemmatimonadota bacterium]